MNGFELARALLIMVVAYSVLFSSAMLYRYGRLSKGRATIAGGIAGCLLSLIVLFPAFDPLAPSLVTIALATGAAALGMRLAVILLNWAFGST